MIVLWLSLVVLLLYVVYQKKNEPKNLPPGAYIPIITPFLDVYNLLTRPIASQKDKFKKYGHIYRSTIFFQNSVVVSGPEMAKWVYQSDGKVLHTFWPARWRELLGPDSIAVVTGAPHALLRRFFAKAFTPSVIEGSLPEIQSITKRYMEEWANRGTIDDLSKETPKFTFDILRAMIFREGLDGGLLENYRTWASGLTSIIPGELPFTSLRRGMNARRWILNEAEKIILRKRKEREMNLPLPQRPSLIDMLIDASDEDGNKLSVAQLKDQIVLIIFAGHETAASAITYVVYYLSSRPDVFSKLKDEIDANIQDVNEPITYAKLRPMVYLNAFISEILRLKNPIGGTVKVMDEDVELAGYTIPKGWMLLMSARLTLLDPNSFENPDEFNPDRFVVDKSPAHAYVPFGGGIRMCPGLSLAQFQLKIVAIYLIKSFRNMNVSNFRESEFPGLKAHYQVEFQKLE